MAWNKWVDDKGGGYGDTPTGPTYNYDLWPTTSWYRDYTAGAGDARVPTSTRGDYNSGAGAFVTADPLPPNNNNTDPTPRTYSGSTGSTGGNGYDAYSALMSYWDSLRAEANAVWNKWLKQRQAENADYRRKVVDQANISKLQTNRGLRQTPNSGPKLSRFVQSNLGHLNTVAEAKREENKANQNDSITAQQGKLGVQTQVANLQSQWLPYLIQNGYTGSINL